MAASILTPEERAEVEDVPQREGLMADIDWKEFGRRLAESTTIRSATSAADWLTEDPTPYVRGCFLDLLAAARWGAHRVEMSWQITHDDRADPNPGDPDPFWEECAGEAADREEAEALRLLTDGFRERLAEIAGEVLCNGSGVLPTGGPR